MQGVFELEIGGAKRTLRFNNYAHTELSKTLFEAGHLVSSPDELLAKLEQLASINVMLLMKALIYAGIIGNDYLIGFKPSVTIQEVGEWMADADEGQLIGVWDTFLSAMGTDVSKAFEYLKKATEGEGEKKN